MGARDSWLGSEYVEETIHSNASWGSIVGLSSSRPTVLAQGTDKVTMAFPLFQAFEGIPSYLCATGMFEH